MRAGSRRHYQKHFHLDSTLALGLAPVEACCSSLPPIGAAWGLVLEGRGSSDHIPDQCDEPTVVLLGSGSSDEQHCTEGHEGCGKQGLVAWEVALVIVVLDLAARSPGSTQALKDDPPCMAGPYSHP